MPQPMQVPTWTGNSIIQGASPELAVPASMPGRSGRDMSSACTGQRSMQTPQLKQPVRVKEMR